MLDKQTRGAILLLRRKGHSLRCISRLLSLSRDSVREVARIGSDEPPITHRPRKLDAHRERIGQMLAEFDGNAVKVHRALADVGTRVRYSTLTAFCRENHLFNRAGDPTRDVMAARQWLLELVNGRHSVESLQSQLSPAADLQFLLSQLKHGRSRHRKKATTILARKRGISNSVIAAALRSSRHRNASSFPTLERSTWRRIPRKPPACMASCLAIPSLCSGSPVPRWCAAS
jgi:DNA-binding transcriptional MerR regulator